MESDSTGYYIEVDEARDSYAGTDRIFTFRRALPRSLKSAYVKASKTKVGENTYCACCHKTFIKKTYQQKFCSDKCRVRYHNRRFTY